MKIGLLTFHYAHNYGAVLQAYALKTVLQNMNHDVKIINYHNKVIEEQYPKEIGKSDSEEFTDWKIKYKRFEDFINHILLDEDTKEIASYEINNTDYDAYIAGSDQIWEPELTGGLDPVYLLDFPSHSKKISYAASKSSGMIPEDEVNSFLDKIDEFDWLSVREKKLQNWLKRNGKRVELVLDPTLLLDSLYYEKMALPNMMKSNYIFVYYVTEDDKMSEFALKISEKLRSEIVEVRYVRVKKDNITQKSDSGPLEFLTLLMNADMVITNSFHGVALSIVFKKEFYAFYEQDNRKSDLLEMLGLERRHIYFDMKLDDKSIDYSLVDSVLKKEKEQSINYLLRSLAE